MNNGSANILAHTTFQPIALLLPTVMGGPQSAPGVEVRGFEDRLEPDDDGGFLSTPNTRRLPQQEVGGGHDPWGHLQGQAAAQGEDRKFISIFFILVRQMVLRTIIAGNLVVHIGYPL